MGILVSPRHVLTCSHVVNVALGRPALYQIAPDAGAGVWVAFPLAEVSQHRARVLHWTLPGHGNPDVALLDLGPESAPVAAGLAILALSGRDDPPGGTGTVLRVTQPGDAGHHAEVRFAPGAGDWRQLSLSSRALDPGTSGAGVHDEARRAVVGMVVASATGSDQPKSYMIPTEVLKRHLPCLPVEASVPGRSWLRLWQGLALTALAVAFMMTVELASGTASGFLDFWVHGDNTLAALFGATILGPVLAAQFHVQARIARAFALRPWYQRVPPLLGDRAERGLRMDPVLAAATLLAFGLAPSYALGNFLDHLLVESRVVVVYNADLNGLRRQDAVCDDAKFSRGMCTHPLATLWSTIPGHPYIKNAYHILGEQGHKANVWPIATPMVLIGFAVAVAAGIFRIICQMSRRPKLESSSIGLSRSD